MPPKIEKDEPAAVEAAATAEPAAAPVAEAAPAAEPADEPAAEAPAEEAAEVPQAPPLTAYLDHDDPDASASHGGVAIVRGENKLFLAPLSFVEELQAHGFRVVSEGK